MAIHYTVIIITVTWVVTKASTTITTYYV